MKWTNHYPEEAGEYIVKTETDFLKRESVMKATMTISPNGEKNWNFKNQQFKSYLNEKEFVK